MNFWTALLALLASGLMSVSYCQIVPGIRCYYCNSEQNPDCGTSSRLTYDLYRDCSGVPGADRCLKLTGPGVLISRTCGGMPDGSPAADGCFISGNVQTCMCSSEFCNGAARHYGISVPFLLVALCVLLVVFRA